MERTAAKIIIGKMVDECTQDISYKAIELANGPYVL